MEGTITIQIERLPEGLYLATSDQVQGLIAQGRTIAETLEIARDVTKKLLEAQDPDSIVIEQLDEKFEYPLIFGF